MSTNNPAFTSARPYAVVGGYLYEGDVRIGRVSCNKAGNAGCTFYTTGSKARFTEWRGDTPLSNQLKQLGAKYTTKKEAVEEALLVK